MSPASVEAIGEDEFDSFLSFLDTPTTTKSSAKTLAVREKLSLPFATEELKAEKKSTVAVVNNNNNNKAKTKINDAFEELKTYKAPTKSGRDEASAPKVKTAVRQNPDRGAKPDGKGTIPVETVEENPSSEDEFSFESEDKLASKGTDAESYDKAAGEAAAAAAGRYTNDIAVGARTALPLAWEPRDSSGHVAPPALAVDTADRIISYRQHMIDISKLTYPIILSEIFQNTLPLVVSIHGWSLLHPCKIVFAIPPSYGTSVFILPAGHRIRGPAGQKRIGQRRPRDGVVQSLEFIHDRLHDSHRHAVVPVVRGKSAGELLRVDRELPDNNCPGYGSRFRGGGPMRALHEALRSGSRIGGRGRGILVQAHPRAVPVLPVQGADEVPAVAESPRSMCMDWIVCQRVQRAVQLVADLLGGMGPQWSTVGNIVDPAGRIRARVSVHVHQQAFVGRYLAEILEGKLALFCTEAILGSCHSGCVWPSGRVVGIQFKDDIGGAVGDSFLECAHYHRDNLRCLQLFSKRDRDRGID